MNDIDPLFRDRVPEAAARQLAIVLAWATECQLATAEGLPARAGRRERDRHRTIADTLIRHCIELGVRPTGLDGRMCPRLADAMGFER